MQIGYAMATTENFKKVWQKYMILHVQLLKYQ